MSILGNTINTLLAYQWCIAMAAIVLAFLPLFWPRKPYQTVTVDHITPDQLKQFKRFVADAGNRALKDFNPNKDGLQRLIERGGEFQAYVVAGLARFTSKLPDYTLARSILGDDFISADKIATARGLVYTEDQLIELGRKLPDQATLEQLRDSGMMLVAGPPTAMSLIDVRAVKADFFCSVGPKQNNSDWYNGANEQFARTDKVEALCWIALRKEPVENSLSKDWPEQQVVVKEPMVIPNVAEVVWALTTYKAVRDIYLLENIYVRTNSVDSDGERMYIGHFNTDGLRVSNCWDYNRGYDLGVSASRKF